MKKNTIVSKTITPSTIRATNARLTNKDTSSRYTVVGARGMSSVHLAGDSWVIQSGNSNPRTVSSSALKTASRNSMKKAKVTSE